MFFFYFLFGVLLYEEQKLTVHCKKFYLNLELTVRLAELISENSGISDIRFEPWKAYCWIFRRQFLRGMSELHTYKELFKWLRLNKWKSTHEWSIICFKGIVHEQWESEHNNYLYPSPPWFSRQTDPIFSISVRVRLVIRKIGVNKPNYVWLFPLRLEWIWFLTFKSLRHFQLNVLAICFIIFNRLIGLFFQV